MSNQALLAWPVGSLSDTSSKKGTETPAEFKISAMTFSHFSPFLPLITSLCYKTKYTYFAAIKDMNSIYLAK